MKGIERLSEDLREERMKAASALQDRARLRVEIEGLKQKILSQATHITETTDTLEERDEQLSKAKEQIKALTRSEEALQRAVGNVDEKTNALEEKNKTMRQEKQNMTLELEQARYEIENLTDSIETLEAKVLNKEKLFADIKAQLELSVNQNEQHEEKIFYLTDQVREQVRTIDSMRETTSRVVTLEASTTFLNESSEELKRELELAFEKNSNLSNELLELNSLHTTEKNEHEKTREQLGGMTRDRDRLKVAAEDWEQGHDDLTGRVAAEKDAAELARNQMDSAKKEVQAIQDQLDEMHAALAISATHNAELDQEIVQNKMTILSLQQEVSVLRGKVGKEESLAKQLKESQHVCQELEQIKIQYLEIRKNNLRKEMESGVSELASTTSASQRSHTHEGIIQDLRQELHEMHAMKTKISKELDDAKRKCCTLDKVEEDLRLLKETAQIVAAERNSAKLIAKEAVERSMKTLHSRDMLVRDVNRAEADAIQAKQEVEALREELVSERNKYRKLHVDKLGCERSAAEFVAVTARAEAVMEEEKEKFTVARIELERAKRTIKEQSLVINKLREKISEMGTSSSDIGILTDSTDNINLSLSRSDNGSSLLLSQLQQRRVLSESASSSLNKSINESKDVEALKLEIQQLHHSKSIAQKEIDTLKQSIKIQRQGFDDALAETLRLHQKCDQLQTKLNAAYSNGSSGGSRSPDRTVFFSGTNTVTTGKSDRVLNKDATEAERAVHRLRAELDETLSKWTVTDNEHSVKNQLISQLQGELQREREKAILIRSQVNVLDDRLHVASEELSISEKWSNTERDHTRKALIGRMDSNLSMSMSMTNTAVEEAKESSDSASAHFLAHTEAYDHQDSTSGAMLSMSDFHTTPQRVSRDQYGGTQTPDNARGATFSGFRSSDRKEMLGHNPRLHIPQPVVVEHKSSSNNNSTNKHLNSKEQLRRRREERERARNIALRGEAFYTASQAGSSFAVAPAKLDFHQARQLLASRQR